jgi:hypothetical protein
MNTIKSLLASTFLGASVLFGGAALAEKPLEPSGTVKIDQTQFGFIIGGSVGGGELTVDGVTHAFKIGGISLGANFGASQLAAAGEVYNLMKLEDFAGNYVTTGGQLALGGGQGGMQLQNSKGVVMRLQATAKGIQFNVGAGGVNVYFDKK